jgi:hypothetical protein
MASKDKSGTEAIELAARLLKRPQDATRKEIQTLAGSVLTQGPDKPKAAPKPKARGR